MEQIGSQKLPRSSARSHSRSPGKIRSPSRESKRKKSSSGGSSRSSSKLPPLPPLPKPPVQYGSSHSWDLAQGQAFVDKVALRAQSGGGDERIDGAPKENKDAPYLALVQLFNQFQGMPLDTKKTLVNVSVLGSTGPLRMLVTSDATVKEVIRMALLRYAHEGRVPTLGRNTRDFDLYDSQFSSHALKHEDRIADFGTRNFVLCPVNLTTPNTSCAGESNKSNTASSGSGSRSWWSYVTGIKSLV